jgi:ABC-type uncharacterized transport system permease subunit
VSSLLVIAALLAASLYALAWRSSVRPVIAAEGGMADESQRGGGTALVLPGALAHLLSLIFAIVSGDAIRFGFAQALSGTLWVGVVMLWFEGLSIRAEALRAVTLPLAGLAALLPLFFPGADFSAESTRPLFVPHLLAGTLAYGVLMLAALHATMMTFAERALHGLGESSSSLSRWVDRLPALLAMERILFRFIGVGFVLLTLTALTGIIFSEEVFGRPLRLDHKTVFTLLSWAIFGALLVGRRLWGWRGRTALRLTLAGFVVLLLAYVGTRFVLEVILRR